MHAGKLSAEDLRLWVANRYYYQTRIPIKDALILAKAEDPGFRRVWIQRLLDHDGPPAPSRQSEASEHTGSADASGAGGLELWRRLGRALGASREELDAGTQLLPAVKRVCDEYVELVRSADLVTAVAASLTEYFAGGLMQARIEAWQRHYPFVAEEALAYFRERVTRAPEDADFALAYVERHAESEAQIQRCLEAFEHKCSILWRLLDAVYIARRLSRRPRLERRVSLCARSQPEPERESPAGVLLVPEQALQLNRTALELLKRCNGGATLQEIVGRLAEEYASPVDLVQMDIASFVGELERRRMLAFSV
jgi:pyrroloquinoline-quinone synthase